jgi:hypothetical protein
MSHAACDCAGPPKTQTTAVQGPSRAAQRSASAVQEPSRAPQSTATVIQKPLIAG